MIKPCFYADGNIYSCPSAELAIENNHRVPSKYIICKYDKIIDFYQSEKVKESIERDCSYCKYAGQQRILKELLTKTNFNEFA
jgi:hypothetical protein